MDLKSIIEIFHDHLATTLDTYEQAIYLYLFRHSRLQGKKEVVVGFKSARLKMAFGVGEKGRAIAEGTCYKKLRSLEKKGCIKILSSERNGTRVQVYLPDEIEGLIVLPPNDPVPNIETMDFFEVAENRLLILQRDNNCCFYCCRSLDSSNYVIEHIISRPEGDNTYRNLVAACRNCNNQKGSQKAEDFIRSLYRKGLLNDIELQERLNALDLVQKGQLKPSQN